MEQNLNESCDTSLYDMRKITTQQLILILPYKINSDDVENKREQYSHYINVCVGVCMCKCVSVCRCVCTCVCVKDAVNINTGFQFYVQ